jgi:hypothetical protein
MTRLSLLQDQKEVLEFKKQALQNKSNGIYQREQQAISNALLPFFSEFDQEVEVEVTRGSVYFKMAHPNYTYKKELFTVYLRENWKFDGVDNTKSFDRVDLSYYSSSTNGSDTWELKRLRLLGKLAEVVEDNSFSMLYAVNQVALSFNAEHKEVYAEMNEVGKELRDIENKISTLEKSEIEFNLKNGGVEFDKGVLIQLKYNYGPCIKSIKLVDLSKSGKTATAVFRFDRGSLVSTEENINVQSIIDQVYGLRKDIVEKELLTSQ